MRRTNKQWQRLKTEEVFANRYFRLRADECRMSDGRIMPKYFTVDFPDWVQVVAREGSGRIVMVDQYRYSGQSWFVEFPGGSTHPNRSEDPLLAAQRELAEETGYTSEQWSYLGHHYPNPALLSNKCHVFFAENCKKTQEQKLDPYEELDVVLLNPSELEDRLKGGGFAHSLMLASYVLAREILNHS